MRTRLGWVLLGAGTVACIVGLVLAVRGKRLDNGASTLTALVVALGIGLVFLGRFAPRDK